MGSDCMSAAQYGQSRSGSIAEETRYEGDSSDDKKFEGDKSKSGNNPNIGKIGWGS